ncbi:MAG: TonB-dependent receptor plug domain-containing protein [Gammaproteobacteria bacterium]
MYNATKTLCLPGLRAGLTPWFTVCLSALVLIPWLGAQGDELVQLPTIEVTERYDSLVGIGDSATEGRIGPEQIESRPLLRPGEVLETVPGVIVTQHSGAGKANQFFLRGFNLDHGTDFATSVAGIPVNFPTHAHGQGYTESEFRDPGDRSRRRLPQGTLLRRRGGFLGGRRGPHRVCGFAPPKPGPVHGRQF